MCLGCPGVGKQKRSVGATPHHRCMFLLRHVCPPNTHNTHTPSNLLLPPPTYTHRKARKSTLCEPLASSASTPSDHPPQATPNHAPTGRQQPLPPPEQQRPPACPIPFGRAAAPEGGLHPFLYRVPQESNQNYCYDRTRLGAISRAAGLRQERVRPTAGVCDVGWGEWLGYQVEARFMISLLHGKELCF